MESEPTGKGGKPNDYKITLLKAVELGEYDPKVLARFPEWQQLTRQPQCSITEHLGGDK